MNTDITHRRTQRRSEAGFTLVEALVSLLVVSFGMLAIAGMQATLAKNADLAKQRTEAVRLAQVKMEELRAFDSIVSGEGTWNYATDVVSGADAPVTPTDSNTAFTLSWAVTGPDGVTPAGANDAQKWIHVTVQWADRASTALNHSITLDSNIARNNPTALKGLVAGQAQPRVRQPRNRNLNIPYPSVALGGGRQSAFIPPPGAVVYVFDNTTGNIVSSCPVPTASITSLSRSGSTVTVTTTGHTFVVGNRVAITGASDVAFNGTFSVVSAPSGTTFTYTMPTPLPSATTATGGAATFQLVEGIILSSAGLTCSGLDAYLLSGYVRFSDRTNSGHVAADAESSTRPTLPLASANPLTIDASATGNGPSAFNCFAQPQVVVSTPNVNPSTIASISRASATGVVTVTTTGAHGLPVSARVATEGLSDFSFEGSFEVVSVPSSTTLTYLQPGADASISGTTSGPVISQIKLIQQITLTASEPIPSAYNSTESVFTSYACVVTPVDDDGNPVTPAAWWGQVDLSPSGWTIGTSSASYRVCRYSGDYVSGGSVSNAEHPRYYRRVSGALTSQNFFVIRGDLLCPGDVPVDFNAGGNSVSDLLNANTVPHQPPSIAQFSYQCLTVNGSHQCSGGNKQQIESSTPTLAVPMF